MFLICAHHGNSQITNRLNIDQFNYARLYDCDQVGRKVIQAIDLKSSTHIINIDDESNIGSILNRKFLIDPGFFRFFVVLKKSNTLVIISVVTNGSFVTEDQHKMKVTQLLKDKSLIDKVEEFLRAPAKNGVTGTRAR